MGSLSVKRRQWDINNLRHQKMRPNLILRALCCVFCFVSSRGWCADYLQESDPAALDSSARYNYYLGEYYYTQGKYNDAEQYFQRSRDLVERKQEVLASKGADTRETKGLYSGAGTDLLSQEDAKETEKAYPSGATTVEYTVGEGDVLYISVWQNDDMNQELIVRPDGKISFPLIGDVQAAGRTITAIDDDLTQRLREFIKFPEISISIRKLGGCKVIVLGQVGRSGVYAVSGNKTILEAIALAGGFTSDAVGNSVILVRGGLQKPQALRLNLKKALRGLDLSDNVPLQPEDIVFVPRTFVSDLATIAMQIIDPVSRGSFIVDFIQKWDRG